jgi:hypothetical protein
MRIHLPLAIRRAVRAAVRWFNAPPSVGPGVHTVTLTNEATFVIGSDGAEAQTVRRRTGIKPLIGGD